MGMGEVNGTWALDWGSESWTGIKDLDWYLGLGLGFWMSGLIIGVSGLGSLSRAGILESWIGILGWILRSWIGIPWF